MNIIVNGGTKGIGKEIVNYLLADQANNIIVTGRDEKVLKAFSESNSNVYPIGLDLTDFENQKKKFLELVTTRFDKVDILINMAGLLITRDFAETSIDEGRLMMETNFFGPAAIIRTLLPLMHKGSHIVNISSMGGYQGSVKYKGLAYYSASKAALSCLTECLAVELSDQGISVNCLAIGSVQTEMLNQAFPGYKAPVKAVEMAEYISGFAFSGHKFFNGKILPVAVGNP